MGKQSQQRSEQDCLACSVWTDHRECLALFHGEGDISQDLDAVERDRKALYREDGGFIHGVGCNRSRHPTSLIRTTILLCRFQGVFSASSERTVPHVESTPAEHDEFATPRSIAKSTIRRPFVARCSFLRCSRSGNSFRNSNAEDESPSTSVPGRQGESHRSANAGLFRGVPRALPERHLTKYGRIQRRAVYENSHH